MGSTNRNQALRLQGVQIALLALTVVSVSHAQQAALSPAAAEADSSAQAPVAVAQVPPDAPVMAPKVVCKGDQITISANNSTLSSVLDEVHRCMGTKIDLPDGAGQKRMFDHIGPGPASQVLDELLSNTGYNYIIGSSPANQEKIDSIMLLARNVDAAAALPSVEDSHNLSANRRAFLQMHQAAIPHPMTDADTAAAAAAAAAESATPTPAPQPAPADGTAAPAPVSPDAQPAAAPADQKPAETAPAVPETPPTTPPPSVTEINGKPATTDDQINNMQQMFELRKQLNQPPAPAPPPQ